MEAAAEAEAKQKNEAYLSSSTVNGISVESDIHDVEARSTHGLLSAGSLLRGPLESGNACSMSKVSSESPSKRSVVPYRNP